MTRTACELWTAPADVHAAHTDPFAGGSVHGHLWRVSLGIRQALAPARRRDVRALLASLRAFAAQIDHTDLGAVSTEDIALRALEACPDADAARVVEVGVCEVLLWR